jgi:hypothetical protein
MDPNLIKEFGFPTAMAITFVVATLWTLKLFIKHFMDSLREANIERKDITTKFTAIVENHIAHNTECLSDICSQMKEMGRDHKEFSVQLAGMKPGQ